MGNQLKIGICEWALPAKMQGPLSCKAAAHFGLNGLEIDFGEYERNFPLCNPYIRDAYLSYQAKYGIEFPSIAVNALCRYGMTNKKGSEKGNIAYMAIRKAIDTASVMKIPLVQLPCFEDGKIRTDADFQITAKCLQDACDYAKDKNILIAIEDALTAEENLEMMETVGRENLSIFFDTQNPHCMAGLNAPGQIGKLGRHISQTHVKDGNKDALSSALLGTGDSGFYQSMSEFKKIGYTGWYILENYYDQYPLSSKNDDPFELLKEDIRILSNCIQALS